MPRKKGSLNKKTLEKKLKIQPEQSTPEVKTEEVPVEDIPVDAQVTPEEIAQPPAKKASIFDVIRWRRLGRW